MLFEKVRLHIGYAIMKNLLMLLSTSFLFWNSNLFAGRADEATICLGCSQEEASSKALERIGPNGAMKIYVTDFRNERLWRFSIQSSSQDGEVTKVSKPSEVEADARALFDAWVKVKYLPAVVSIKAPETIDISSAYELPGYGRAKNLIAAYLRDNIQRILNFPTEVISDEYTQISHGALAFLGATKDCRVEVQFPDGSSAQYKLDFPIFIDETDVRFVLMEQSLADSDGNIIPYARADLESKTGDLVMSRGTLSNLENWISMAERLGFEVVGDWVGADVSACSYHCLYEECDLNCARKSN